MILFSVVCRLYTLHTRLGVNEAANVVFNVANGQHVRANVAAVDEYFVADIQKTIKKIGAGHLLQRFNLLVGFFERARQLVLLLLRRLVVIILLT